MKPLNVLVVDDEQSICLLLRDVLTRLGHTVTTCTEGEAALETAEDQQLDLAFLDIRMPGMGGLEALKRLRVLQPDAIFVMITGFAKTDIIDEALRSGASACLCKPFNLSQVMKLLKDIEQGSPISV